MRRIFKKLIILTLTPTISWASTTICKVEEISVGVKAVAWDSSTGIAKLTDILDNYKEGRVTLSRKHNDDGIKTNLYFKNEKTDYGIGAQEFIVFPISKNKYRIIGVSYLSKDGVQYLNASEGNYSATCLSM